MAIHPNTLQQGFNLGVLDHTDYCNPPIAPYGQGMYLNNAMQGNLYKQYGSNPDSFHYTSQTSPVLYNQQIGSNGNCGYESFGLNNGIGSQGVAGLNSYGLSGIGSESQLSLEKSMGGFADVKSNSKKIDGIPTVLKGIAALGIAFTSIALLFRGKKIPKTY